MNESRNIVTSNINNMLKEQLLNQTYGNGNSECAGTYYVNGYTRKDGTEVEGYMRTCGAEHASHGSQTSSNLKCLNDYTKNFLGIDPNMDIDASIQYNIAKKNETLAIIHQYYRLSLLFADNSENPKNMYRNNIYKFNETPEFVDKNYAFNKIKNSLKLGGNKNSDIEKIQNTMVVIPQENAEIINKIKRSPITAQMVKENFNEIVNGKTINTSIEYNQTNNFNEGSLYGIIKKTDVRELKLNEDGTISFYIVDMYDFEKLKQDKNANWKKNAFVPINNRAYQQQAVGKLQPYLLYIPITLSISEIFDMVNK